VGRIIFIINPGKFITSQQYWETGSRQAEGFPSKWLGRRLANESPISQSIVATESDRASHFDAKSLLTAFG